MHYPIYVHQDGDSAWGATFPDIPGCFTAADSLEDLPRAAQEAVEVHFEGETDAVPAPCKLSDLKDQAMFTGGFWMLVDIDLSKINTASERVNVSFPGNVLRRIDDYASARGMTRSGFLTFAAARMMDESVAVGVVGDSMDPGATPARGRSRDIKEAADRVVWQSALDKSPPGGPRTRSRHKA